MASNQFLPFAAGGGANALTPAAWAALSALLATGFQAGTASSAQINTVLRQVSTVASALGQIINDQGGDALDNGSPAAFATALKTALGTLFAPLSSVGGRPGRVYTNNDWTWIDKAQGLILQWGVSASSTAEGLRTVTFPTVFPNTCFFALPVADNTSGLTNGSAYDNFAQFGSANQSGASLYVNNPSTTTIQSTSVVYIALGR